MTVVVIMLFPALLYKVCQVTFLISIIKNALSNKKQIDFQFSVDKFLWVKKYCHHYTSHHNIKYEKNKNNYQTSEIRNKQ
jgi:hypothetical protein